MPIQIKEIVVVATIEPHLDNKDKGVGGGNLDATLAKLKEEILNECLSAIYAQERKNKDR